MSTYSDDEYKRKLNWENQCEEAQTHALIGLWRAGDNGLYQYACDAHHDGQQELMEQLPGQGCWVNFDGNWEQHRYG